MSTFTPVPRWKNYLTLCKPNVVAEMLFTAIVGMLLALPTLPPIDLMFYGLVGIGFASASAAAINHFIDRHADGKMRRTENRPLPQGTLSSANVLIFATILGVSAMILLITKVNMITAILTFLSLFGYAFIYTCYLKRATPQNIVIGGLFGSTPPLLGWCAMTGEVHPYALLLALIIFVWTPPHFWALALYRREDYEKSGLPMLPVTHGEKFTLLHIVLYTLILLAATLLPYIYRMSGVLYLVSALILGAMFMAYAVALYRKYSDELAKKTFRFSIIYLSLLFAALLIDHYV